VRDVSYEALVEDPERQIPVLVTELAGLSWDAATLSPHELGGAVQTARASQVRSPIYQSSVERWRRHAERLRPLAEALGLDEGI
jgi:hypothetical protein